LEQVHITGVEVSAEPCTDDELLFATALFHWAARDGGKALGKPR
jgi:hypothetical protein